MDPMTLNSGADMGAALDAALAHGYTSGKVEFYTDAAHNQIWGLELNGPNQCIATMGDTLIWVDDMLVPANGDRVAQLLDRRNKRQQ